MNRRNFLGIIASLIPGALLLKIKAEKTLQPGFKYLGEGVYSYNKPSWVESTGKWHYLVTQHSKHLTAEEASMPDVIREYRIQTAKQSRETQQFIKKSDVAIVIEENWEVADMANCVESKGLDNKWRRKTYNSVRYFLIDRKTLEKEIWS